MTTLTITPDVAKKKLKLAGTVASGEKVAVTVAGFGTVSTTNLRLRVMAGDVPVGYFPLEDEDEWTVSGSDLTCTLDLATWQAERHCKLGAEVCFILEDTGTPQLYGVSDFSLRPWIKLTGVDVPKNLDNYKVQMMTVFSEIDRVEALADGKYEKPSGGIPSSDMSQAVQTSLAKADTVTMKVSKSAFDSLLGLSLPDTATQKDTRIIVQRILGVLQSAATCIALMFALPSFGIDTTTAWEDVPPQSTVKSVVEQFAPPQVQKVESVNGKTGTVVVTASDIECYGTYGTGTVQSVFNGFRETYNNNIQYFLVGHTSSDAEKRWDMDQYNCGRTFDWRVNEEYDVGFNWILVEDVIFKGWDFNGDHSLTNALKRFLVSESDPTVHEWAKAPSKPQYGWSEITGKPDIATRNDATNAAEAVVREKSLGGIWDKQLEVWWTPVMVNGGLTYQATTNVDLNAGN